MFTSTRFKSILLGSKFWYSMIYIGEDKQMDLKRKHEKSSKEHDWMMESGLC